MGWWKKLRGLAGVGVTWGAVWATFGAGIGAILGAVSPDLWIWSNPIVDWAVGMGLYGFVSGVGFGTVLTLRGGRSTLFGLSLPRMALWGVLGAVAVPLVFGAIGMFGAGTTVVDIVQAMLLTGVLGGASAPATVAIARRAALAAGEEVGRIEDGDAGLLGEGEA